MFGIDLAAMNAAIASRYRKTPQVHQATRPAQTSVPIAVGMGIANTPIPLPANYHESPLMSVTTKPALPPFYSQQMAPEPSMARRYPVMPNPFMRGAFSPFSARRWW